MGPELIEANSHRDTLISSFLMETASNLDHSALISTQLRRPAQRHPASYSTTERTELIFTGLSPLCRYPTFIRCCSLCLYCNKMGDLFSITLSSLIGLWPCWWVRDEKGGGVGGSKDFLQGLKLTSPTHCELLWA